MSAPALAAADGMPLHARPSDAMEVSRTSQTGLWCDAGKLSAIPPALACTDTRVLSSFGTAQCQSSNTCLL